MQSNIWADKTQKNNIKNITIMHTKDWFGLTPQQSYTYRQFREIIRKLSKGIHIGIVIT